MKSTTGMPGVHTAVMDRIRVNQVHIWGSKDFVQLLRPGSERESSVMFDPELRVTQVKEEDYVKHQFH